MGTIVFDHLGIGTALSRHRLAVPVNQRDYSWKQEHVLALFQDLSGAIGGNKSAYFLGTIVLTSGKKVGELEVADGQQRLATSTILLAAIRDYLCGRDADMIVYSIETDFLFTIVRTAKKTTPRLKLNVNDHEYFEKRILARPDNKDRNVQPAKESHHRINAAAAIAKEHVQNILSGHAEKHHEDVLNRWIDYLKDFAQVIVLSVPDDLNAFVMFETLNDRGLKTSQADLLKNYLFGQAGDRLSEAQQKWSVMAGALESLGIDDITITYLRHLTIALHGYTIEREVYERIRERTKGEGPTLQFLDALERNAMRYVALFAHDHAAWNGHPPGIRKSVRAMCELRALPFRPLMLAVATAFTPAEAEKAFRFFVRLAVRFLIAGGGRSGSVEKACADCAVKVTKKEIATAKEVLTELRKVTPTDTEFEDAFAKAKVSQNYLARYYLRSLELKLKQMPDPEWIPNEDVVINLEHVLPETPGGNWPDVDPETAAANYRRIGNLALLQAAKNVEIGNEPFSAKQPALKASTYILTKEIGLQKKWGLDQINARQQRLAKLAVETWPLQI